MRFGKVTDSGGLGGNDQISVTINVGNTAPSVTLLTPPDGSTHNEGDSINFSASANDTEDGDISASINWTLDIDGNLGTGASLAINTLSPDVHTITASVTDSGGLSGSDFITLTVNSTVSCGPPSRIRISGMRFGPRLR